MQGSPSQNSADLELPPVDLLVGSHSGVGYIKCLSYPWPSVWPALATRESETSQLLTRTLHGHRRPSVVQLARIETTTREVMHTPNKQQTTGILAPAIGNCHPVWLVGRDELYY